MSGQYTIQWLCEALQVSRSGYYDWLHRRQHPGPRARENLALRARLREEFARSRQTYGSPRLARALSRKGSRHRIARLMRQERLVARQRSKYRVRTTDSRHADPIAPNRLPAVVLQRPNQAWATDATGVLTGEGWLYLVGLLDLYSRCLVGWAMHATWDAALAVKALQMALDRRRPAPALLVHSDRGCQFASATYRATLAAHHLVASMSRHANCYDNAHMESFWSSLKAELVHRRHFATRAEARQAIFDYIETFYNRTRLHSSLGYMSPLAFESKLT